VIEFLRHLATAGELHGLTDGELLKRFLARRDEAAFAALVQRHGPLVWRTCQHLLRTDPDAEDAFQAVFLVLLKKAGALTGCQALGPWLYGVAHRVATRARTRAARRQARARGGVEMLAATPAEQADPDVQPILHEEVGRLPEKYRAAVVLCYFQGLTNEEAAARLRCPVGTLKALLRRARERLRGRLARRGLAPSAGLLAAPLGRGGEQGAVPVGLVDATNRAAAALAAGHAAPVGGISDQAAVLAEGVLKAMLWTNIPRAAVVLLLGLGVALSTGAVIVWAAQARGPGGENAARPVKATPAWDVALAYLGNDAAGDGQFLGKRLRVVGRLSRVKRVGHGADGPAYYLVTLRDVSSQDRGVIRLWTDDMDLAFKFSVDARPQLAELKGGDELTIEGHCEGRTAEGGHEPITFSEGKLIGDR
jgi:RNA polymerase sigma factor (sigma-70 family)